MILIIIIILDISDMKIGMMQNVHVYYYMSQEMLRMLYSDEFA